MSEVKRASDGIQDYFLDSAEAVAFEGLKKIKAYFAYEGNDRKPLERAKIAAAMIGAYSRMQASQTNRMAVELATKKFEMEGPRIAVLEPGEQEQRTLQKAGHDSKQ